MSRVPSELDEAVIKFTSVLSTVGVSYVIVSGYVAILTGRSRGTEDVDVILEPLSNAEVDALVTTLSEQGYWGMAMPLEEMYAMLSEGDRIRVAAEGTMFPNFELWFASNEVERTALRHAVTAELDDGSFEISPLELQLAYKLRLAQRGYSRRERFRGRTPHPFDILHTAEAVGFLALGVWQ